MYSRERFLEEHPDKDMLKCKPAGSNWGTSKYDCEWSGDWQGIDLINYCDNSQSHYGGRIENVYQTDSGTYKGTVCVYYN